MEEYIQKFLSFVFDFLFIYFYRELALQIADQFRAFGAPIHLKVAVIVGGESM